MLTRRRALGALALGAAAPGLAACSSGSRDQTTLWYWTNSISDSLLDQAPKHVRSLDLARDKIGGDFETRLLTSLAGHSNVPDITGLNSDIANYMPNESQFLDLYQYGARDVQHLYLDWKWKQGVSPRGRLIGFPMDTGPAALFYRADVYEKAGLPSDPADLAKAVPTWEKFLDLAATLHKKVPGSSAISNITNIYSYVMAQSVPQYVTPDGRYIGDQPHVRRAWNIAVEAARRNLSSASRDSSTEWSAGLANGRIASIVGAVWVGQQLAAAAPGTSGEWRVASCPGGAGNLGGSFLAVTKYCRNPQLAFDTIRWLQSPANQVHSFVDSALFPSTPSAYNAPALRAKTKFFGNQETIDVFGPTAKLVKPLQFSPYDTIVTTPITDELANVESLGKNPDRAWSDAQSNITRALKLSGVT